MKRHLPQLTFLLFLLLFSGLARVQVQAQTYPPINGDACENCFPEGWSSVIPYPTTAGPDLINGNMIFSPAGDAIRDISRVSPTGGTMAKLFFLNGPVSIYDAKTTITGLTSGEQYYVSFYWQQFSTYLVSFGMPIEGAALLVTIDDVKYPIFISANAQDDWQLARVRFRATGTTAKLTIAAVENFTSYYTVPGMTGIVVDDAGENSVVAAVCEAGFAQASLSASSAILPCNTRNANILQYELGNEPSGTGVVWFDNARHNGTPVNPVFAPVPGTYYAFIYDPINDCYGADVSNASVTVTHQNAPAMSELSFLSCETATRSFTITNYVEGANYSFSPSTNVSRSGAVVTALPGTYLMSVETNGCTSSTKFTIPQGPVVAPTPTFTITQPTCENPTGTVTINSPAFSRTFYVIDPAIANGEENVFTNLPTGGPYTIKASSVPCTSTYSPSSEPFFINPVPSNCCTSNAGTLSIVP